MQNVHLGIWEENKKYGSGGCTSNATNDGRKQPFEGQVTAHPKSRKHLSSCLEN